MKESSFNALNITNRFMMFHQQDSLHDEEIYGQLKGMPIHIYMICRSPIITVDLDNCKIEKDEIMIKFNSLRSDEITEITIRTNNDEENPIVEFQSQYPFRSIDIIRKNDPTKSTAKACLLLRHLASNKQLYLEQFDLEVLYVGQAFGKDGNRITFDRLKKHEKAQQIYFDTQEKYPGYEIWFLSMSIEPRIQYMFIPTGRNDINDAEINQGVEKHLHILQNPITTDQQINVMEACMINYFDTYQYNKTFMEFPNPRHSSYDQCYKLDLNSVAFELTSNSIYSKLWSKSVKPDFMHMKPFFLHSDKDKKNMFDFFLNK